MFSHVMLGANDMDASVRFYDAVLGALGHGPARFDAKGRAMWPSRAGSFLLGPPIDGAAACHANGGTVGFAAESPEQADAWHAAGIANGGAAVEDPPGWRELPFGRIYLAYLRDPDGNKLCAMHRGK